MERHDLIDTDQMGLPLRADIILAERVAIKISNKESCRKGGNYALNHYYDK